MFGNVFSVENVKLHGDDLINYLKILLESDIFQVSSNIKWLSDDFITAIGKHVEKYNLNEWIDILQNNIGISKFGCGTGNIDVHTSFKDWKHMLEMSKNIVEVQYKGEYRSCFDGLILYLNNNNNSDGTIFERLNDNEKGGIYYYIPSFNQDQSILEWGKYQSDYLSVWLEHNVEWLNGLSYVSGIIGQYCAGENESKNIQALFDCYKEQLKHYQNDVHLVHLKQQKIKQDQDISNGFRRKHDMVCELNNTTTDASAFSDDTDCITEEIVDID